jgi:hypothetical protein
MMEGVTAADTGDAIGFVDNNSPIMDVFGKFGRGDDQPLRNFGRDLQCATELNLSGRAPEPRARSSDIITDCIIGIEAREDCGSRRVLKLSVELLIKVDSVMDVDHQAFAEGVTSVTCLNVESIAKNRVQGRNVRYGRVRSLSIL